MAKKDLSPDQVRELRENPNVVDATSRRIIYKNEFKKKFIEEYRAGKGPREIFKEAGFDVDALGYKRIERASDRWRRANNEGLFGDKIDFVKVHDNRVRHRESMQERISKQKDEIKRLQEELTELREKLHALET